MGDRGRLTGRCPAADATNAAAAGKGGDLAKKMLLPALYRLTERGLLKVPVVGVAYSDFDDEALRAHARQSVTDAGHMSPTAAGYFEVIEME